jgi:hypothetical protein
MALAKAVSQDQIAALQQEGDYAIKSSEAQPALGELPDFVLPTHMREILMFPAFGRHLQLALALEEL